VRGTARRGPTLPRRRGARPQDGAVRPAEENGTKSVQVLDPPSSSWPQCIRSVQVARPPYPLTSLSTAHLYRHSVHQSLLRYMHQECKVSPTLSLLGEQLSESHLLPAPAAAATRDSPSVPPPSVGPTVRASLEEREGCVEGGRVGVGSVRGSESECGSGSESESERGCWWWIGAAGRGGKCKGGFWEGVTAHGRWGGPARGQSQVKRRG